MKSLKGLLLFSILLLLPVSFLTAQNSSSVADLEKQKAKAIVEENYSLAGELTKQIKDLKEKETLEKAKLIADQQRKASKAKELIELEKQKKDAVAAQDYTKAAEIKKKILKLTELDELEKQKKDAVAKQEYGLAAELNTKIKILKEAEDQESAGLAARAEREAQIVELAKQKKDAIAKEDYTLAAELTTKIQNLKADKPVSGGKATSSQAGNTQIVKSNYPTGELMSETPMLNGKSNGIMKMYHKNGKLQLEMPYKDGVITGNQKSYSETGQLLIETEMLDGKIHGVQRVYNKDNGKVVMETEYRSNKADGKSRTYDERGQAIMEMTYVDGVVVGKPKIGAQNISQQKLAMNSSNSSSGSTSTSSYSPQKYSGSSSGSTTYTKSESSKIRQSEDNTTAGIKYRRSSLYTMMINDGSRQYADVIAQSFVDSPLPIKFNDHDLNEKLIPAYSGGDQLSTIDQYLNTNAIAKSIVAKWFGRNEKGAFNMDLIAQRGNYNASVGDLQIAALSARGNALLADAGEDLIGNTFVVINDFKYTSKEEVANKAKVGMSLLSGISSLAGGPDLSAAATITNAGLTVAGKGYIIKNTSYLFRLVWNEEVAAQFYQNYWIDNSSFDAAKKAAFENSNLFTLKYIGQESALADLQSNVFTSKTEEELIARATAKAVDAGIAKLQRKFEEFRTKTPLYTVDPLTARVGLKEGVEAGDRFEVLEGVQDVTGKITYVKKGVIKVDHIWDNRFDVGELNAPAGNQYSTFKGVGTFYPGMLIKQIN